MSRFHALSVKDIRKETHDAVSIAFDIPDDLLNTFRFTQGQYLTLRQEIDGEDVRRSYSICTGIHDHELRVAVKQVPGGSFSTFANQQLKPGDYLEVMPPQGKFFVPLDPNREGHYLAVTAGSGVTPIMSIVSSTLESEPHSHFTVIYGNRSTTGTLFRERLQDLKDRYLERLNIIYVFSREQQEIDLYNGRIDANKCNAMFDRWVDVPKLDAAFICGPQEMTESVRDVLTQYGLSKEKVHFELFTASTPTAGAKRRQAAKAEHADSAASLVQVMIDGRTIEYNLPRNTQNILDAGNEHGADLPFSCKAGVCSTCKAKVIEGEVEMDVNFALEDYEIDAGYVLSCQCYPISDKVVLDYDEV